MKFKSKWFCVATEGGTTDGRAITREWIQQMAAGFDRAKYGARVWLEHMRGLLPDGPFKAYGDVLALEAREKDGGKLGLYAQIEPTDDLVRMNKARQKIYSSIEINPDFAGSGSAYLVGLAVTDSPASLGTDILAFTQTNPAGSPLTGRKLDKDNLFSVAEPVELVFEEVSEQPAFAERMKGLIQKLRGQTSQHGDQFTQVLDAMDAQAEAFDALKSRCDALERKFSDSQQDVAQAKPLSQRLDALQQAFNQFKQGIETADAGGVQRPAASGGNGAIETDC